MRVGAFVLMVLIEGAVLCLGGCALFATRPVQEMSNTSAAMRAAKEVQADTLAPELFRQANEWFFKARAQYKFKNFQEAHEYATKARVLAEQAEFEAIRNGGVRSDGASGGGSADATQGTSSEAITKEMPESVSAEPTPVGTPVEVYDQRKAAEDKAEQQQKEAVNERLYPKPAAAPGLPPAAMAPPAAGVNPTAPQVSPT
jgi:hypothetical protein